MGKAPTDEACNCWTNETLAHSVEAAKECKFNDEAKAFAAALKTCKSTFSECRKYEDEVAESIAACKSNADDLKKEVAALAQNAEAVDAAQEKVKTLAASRRMKREDGAASCTEVGNMAIQLINVVLEHPSSPQILVFSATIVSFPSTVVCTDDEKGALASVNEGFEAAASHLEAAIEAAQSQLMTLTGVTASPAEIAAVIATDTPPAILLTTPAAADTTPAPGETTPGPMDPTPAPGDTTPGPMDTPPDSAPDSTPDSTPDSPPDTTPDT